MGLLHSFKLGAIVDDSRRLASFDWCGAWFLECFEFGAEHSFELLLQLPSLHQSLVAELVGLRLAAGGLRLAGI